ncbi:MAG: glycosyl hydrolase [Candidatus Izemoplasmatales bacterium]
MKKILIFNLLFLLIFIVGCTNNTTTENETTTIGQTTENSTTSLTNTSSDTTIGTTTETTTEITTIPYNDTIDSVLGLEDKSIIVNHYFNPMENVSAQSTLGLDITAFLEIVGAVDYGTIGEYQLTYQLNYNGDFYSQTVTVSVIDGTYIPPTGDRPISLSGNITVDEGSYFTGLDTSIAHPVNPSNIRANLLEVAIPSSGWWTSLLAANYGGSNGIYTNPLRVAFANEGMEITNPLDGFVQYWNPDGYQTIAQFPISLKDSYLRSSDLNAGYVTEVIDYSDSFVKVAMKNSLNSEDEMVVTLVQGSPYVFAETANKNALTYTMDPTAQIEYYELSGNQITNNTYIGDAIIVKMVHRHSGYICTPPANVLGPEYTDKYYLVNAPEGSSFNISTNVLSMTLFTGNYISIAAINDLSEADFYHEHGYTMITNTSIDYQIDYEQSLVYTDYIASTQKFRSDVSLNPLLSLMPHHYKYSNASLTEYSYRTVRGTLKVMEGNYFQTILPFNGLLPGYTVPHNSEFSATQTKSYLEDLDSRTEITDLENFYNDEAPYWNSKALYPLAQGLIIADQLGEEELKLSFTGKLGYLLADWYKYSGTTDEKYLYYNNSWGSVYYSNDDFGTASSLSDHSFTHGYLIYASAVLAMYDDSFKEDYGMMVNLLLDDYMYPYKDDAEFSYLRNFDPWAGHTWAHGFGTFAEGNNLESTSEALNSWNAGYLWALATNDRNRMDAAIYGFVTEISAVKEYWFDYDEENWDPAFGDYVDVAGMVWGGKHDYATWFGANPTFIYGIQWLPTGEYLTNYALNDEDYTKFSSIYATYLEAKDGSIDTWYSNMWAIQAIINPQTAINEFDENLILNDDYPAELVGTYWMINALDSLERRNADVWMEIQVGVASTIYEDANGDLYAMIWNASNQDKSVIFYNDEGIFANMTVSPNSFTKVVL